MRSTVKLKDDADVRHMHRSIVCATRNILMTHALKHYPRITIIIFFIMYSFFFAPMVSCVSPSFPRPFVVQRTHDTQPPLHSSLCPATIVHHSVTLTTMDHSHINPMQLATFDTDNHMHSATRMNNGKSGS